MRIEVNWKRVRHPGKKILSTGTETDYR